MKKLLLIIMLSIFGTLLLAFAPLSPIAQAQDTVFFDSLYDVPIMRGLREVEEQSMSFDKVQGRLAYASAAANNLKENDILAFYSNTLPQLGWDELSLTTYIREQEKLVISFEDNNDPEAPKVSDNLVKFSLSPHSP